ncbi:F-box/LRR-repeat protein 13-like [Gossypium australe]|uniref:F-box/LRR-repeat protein 13-like n=1 Tax=Gossypium australe TaxID=47621 RepID=A0A5B6WJ24_9ROSI|nr:F-box/LRR-repeat protein 13-like [Gossypium australe]
MALNNYQWQVTRTTPTKAASVCNLDAITMLSNQIELLSKKISSLCSSTQVHPVMQYDTNGGRISNTEYPPYNHGMKNKTGGGVVNPEYPPYEHGMENEQVNYMVLKNQQAPNQGLENQIGQLAKLISERPQGILPSNTESNPKEQIQAITAQKSEGLDEPNPKEEPVVSEGKVEVSHEIPKSVITEYQPRIPYPEALKRYNTY